MKHIAVMGNPNSGKSTIFNGITGARQKVGNFPGVTVEKKSGRFRKGENDWLLTDLPGTYSLTGYSEEETVATEFLANEKLDLVLNIVDAGNLERNLYLSTQLLELDIPLFIVFNKMDLAEKNGLQFDIPTLEELFGVPIFPISGNRREDIEALINSISETLKKSSKEKRNIPYTRDLESAIVKVSVALDKEDCKVDSRWYAIQMLSKSKNQRAIEWQHSDEIRNLVKETIADLEKLFNDNTEALFSYGRYGFISGAVSECVSQRPIDVVDVSRKIDRVLTNRLLGIPIFLFFMWATFSITFSLGAYFGGLIEAFFPILSRGLEAILPAESILTAMLTDGVINGIGSFAVFLPNIFIFFFILAFFEDSGYMARIAFIMDRLMHTLSLHGKAFIPMIMGFSCNVTAIMGTRILDTKRDRIISALVNPFMSCTARLPVYILLASAFFPENANFVVFFMYILGIVLAILSGKLFSKTLLKGQSQPFVLELPPYLLPTARNLFLHTWERGSIFIKKMATVIFMGSVIVWAASYFPLNTEAEPETLKLIQLLESQLQNEENPVFRAELDAAHLQAIAEENSGKYISKIGRILEPIMAPLGFNWQDAVALIMGFIAKEMVVSTYGTLYGISSEEGASKVLQQRLRDTLGSPFTAFGLLVFVLVYTPCVATIAAIGREIGRRWAIFSVFYSLTLAWILAFAIHQFGKLFS